ncbi:MAG: hypothetical protein OXF73_12610, partial [Gammaproteobacteria bacterium]|nr:hypothetical protein [Gammaproteobacteria bacterium]
RFPGPAIRTFARHAPAGIGGNCRGYAENPEKVPEWRHVVPVAISCCGRNARKPPRKPSGVNSVHMKAL